ncbi:MAG TPA: TIGR04282 family arsenosugar biosynthesis glycosyltransferase [Candidatus Binatia bacterium]
MRIRANALAVMAKVPIPGSVKTRLTPFFSAAQAAALARALLMDQLENLRALRNADLYLAFAPASARRLIRHLAPPQFEIFPQRGAELGARMQNVFATLFTEGYQRIVLIGGDLPPVPLDYFTRALAYLDHPESRAVLGPTHDGGYYLVGLNRNQPAIFDQMTWSHDQVLRQTLERIVSFDIKGHLLPRWHDIDTIDDVRCLQSTLARLVEKTAPRTFSFLRQIKLR